MGARLKFWRRSRVPKKGSRDEAVEISRGFAALDGSAVKSHSTTTQYRQLRRLPLRPYFSAQSKEAAHCGRFGALGTKLN